MHDSSGNILKEGDPVALPIGFGILGVAQIVRISSGLITPGMDPRQQAQSTITVQINVDIPAHPNGLVQGIVKLGQRAEAPSEPAKSQLEV